MIGRRVAARVVATSTSRVQQQAIIQQVRHLNLHEYQSKKLLHEAGVNIQKFNVADTPEQAAQMSKDLDVPEIVMKAQIHAGGRGKGTFRNSGFKGGVHLSRDPEEIGRLASKMLGDFLVTKQTPPDGVKVNKIMVAEALDIVSEKYLAILMDRESSGPVLVGSPDGGMDIEAVAEKTPERIMKVPVDIKLGLDDQKLNELAAFLGFEGKSVGVCNDQIKKLYDMFLKVDATQVEINPLGVTPDERIVCFDAKVNFDDNANFRQKEIFAQADTTEEDPREVKAAEHGLNYIGMDGNIGCLVNGAGLAMATMDIIKLNGGEPSNFLDVGGGVTEKGVTRAFQIISEDPKVKAILVNIFGGIVDCDIIAKGIVSAMHSLGDSFTLPLVVRLAGTNVDAARKTLDESNLPIKFADNLDSAARTVVACI